MTVEFVIANTDIRAHETIAQLDMTNTTFKAVNVVEKSKRLYDHRCSSTCKIKFENILISLTITGLADFVKS